MGRHKMPAVFVFGLTLCMMVGCRQGVSREVFGSVLAARGNITCVDRDGGIARAVRVNSRFAAGAIIRTDANSSVDLELVPGIRLRLGERSELQVEQLQLAKDGNETRGGMLNRTAVVALRFGRATADFEETESPAGQLVITASGIAIRTKPGSVVQVQSDGAIALLTNADGETYAGQPDKMTKIEPEWFARWSAGIFRVAPVALNPEAKENLKTSLQIAEVLGDLDGPNLDSVRR